MPVTFIVEPNPGGHRFQYVGHVAAVAAKTGRVVVLSSAGARDRAEFDNYLAHLPIELAEPFDGPQPATREVARAVAEACQDEQDATVVVMEADHVIKRWWLDAPHALRGGRGRPRIVLFFMRFPSRLTFADRTGWGRRATKTALSLLAFAARSAHRVLYLTGRDDLGRGVLLHRVRDPAICTAHADDRAAIRSRLDLPPNRRLVGILGGISGHKNVPLISAATQAAGPDVDLLLAGPLLADMAGWLDSLSDAQASRVIVRSGFLANAALDEYVAACDVVAIAQDNNAPSGIMGKAVAAGVPVLTAGSKIRAHECATLHAGIDVPMTVAGLADGITRLLDYALPTSPDDGLLPTATEFGEVILGRR